LANTTTYLTKLKKYTIMGREPTLTSVLYELMPENKKDIGSVAVCSDGCSCDSVSVPVHDGTTKPTIVTCGMCDGDYEDGSVMSAITESKDEITPKAC
jgi:hypothetical protein